MILYILAVVLDSYVRTKWKHDKKKSTQKQVRHDEYAREPLLRRKQRTTLLLVG